MYVCDRFKHKVVELEQENTKLKKTISKLTIKEQMAEDKSNTLREMHDQIINLQSKMKDNTELENKLNTSENGLKDARERLKAQKEEYDVQKRSSSESDLLLDKVLLELNVPVRSQDRFRNQGRMVDKIIQLNKKVSDLMVISKLSKNLESSFNNLQEQNTKLLEELDTSKMSEFNLGNLLEAATNEAKKVVGLTNKIVDLEDSNGRYRGMILKQNENFENLKELANKVPLLEQELDIHLEQINNQKETIQSLNQDKIHLTKQFKLERESIEQDLQLKNKEFEYITKDLKLCQKDKNNYIFTNESKDSELKRANMRIESASFTNEELSKELETLKSRVKDLSSEKNNLKEEITELQLNAEKAQESFKREISTKNDDIELLEINLSKETKFWQNKVENDNNTQEKQTDDLKQEFTNKINNMKALHEIDMAEKQNKVEDLNNEIVYLNSLIDDLKSEMDRIVSISSKQDNDNRIEIETKSGEVFSLKEIIRHKMTELKASEQKFENLSTNYNNNKKEILESTYQNELESNHLNKKLKDNFSKIDQFQQEISHLKSELQISNSDLDDASKKQEIVPELKKLISDLEYEKEKLSDNFEEACNKIDDFQKYFVELKEKNEMIKQFQEQTENILSEKDQLLTRFENLEKDNILQKKEILEYEKLSQKMTEMDNGNMNLQDLLKNKTLELEEFQESYTKLTISYL